MLLRPHRVTLVSVSRSMQQAGIHGLITSLNAAGKYMYKVRWRTPSYPRSRPISHLATKVTRGRSGSHHHRRRYVSQTCRFLCSRRPHMLKFPLCPEREALLGLRSHAHFYGAFQTSRRYSSSGIPVQERRRGKLSRSVNTECSWL